MTPQAERSHEFSNRQIHHHRVEQDMIDQLSAFLLTVRTRAGELVAMEEADFLDVGGRCDLCELQDLHSV